MKFVSILCGMMILTVSCGGEQEDIHAVTPTAPQPPATISAGPNTNFPPADSAVSTTELPRAAGDLAPDRPGVRPQDQTLTGTDAVIVDRVLASLHPLGSNVVAAVRIKMIDGVATLQGSLPSAELRTRVEELTAASAGVREVKNEIEVEPVADPLTQ